MEHALAGIECRADLFLGTAIQVLEKYIYKSQMCTGACATELFRIFSPVTGKAAAAIMIAVEHSSSADTAHPRPL